MALVYLINKPHVSGCITRWLLLIMEYEFTVVYKLGCTHVVADALSRLLDITVPTRVTDQTTNILLFMLQLVWLEEVRIYRWNRCLEY